MRPSGFPQHQQRLGAPPYVAAGPHMARHPPPHHHYPHQPPSYGRGPGILPFPTVARASDNICGYFVNNIPCPFGHLCTFRHSGPRPLYPPPPAHAAPTASGPVVAPPVAAAPPSTTQTTSGMTRTASSEAPSLPPPPASTAESRSVSTVARDPERTGLAGSSASAPMNAAASKAAAPSSTPMPAPQCPPARSPTRKSPKPHTPNNERQAPSLPSGPPARIVSSSEVRGEATSGSRNPMDKEKDTTSPNSGRSKEETDKPSSRDSPTTQDRYHSRSRDADKAPVTPPLRRSTDDVRSDERRSILSRSTPSHYSSPYSAREREVDKRYRSSYSDRHRSDWNRDRDYDRRKSEDERSWDDWEARKRRYRAEDRSWESWEARTGRHRAEVDRHRSPTRHAYDSGRDRSSYASPDKSKEHAQTKVIRQEEAKRSEPQSVKSPQKDTDKTPIDPSVLPDRNFSDAREDHKPVELRTQQTGPIQRLESLADTLTTEETTVLSSTSTLPQKEKKGIFLFGVWVPDEDTAMEEAEPKDASTAEPAIEVKNQALTEVREGTQRETGSGERERKKQLERKRELDDDREREQERQRLRERERERNCDRQRARERERERGREQQRELERERERELERRKRQERERQDGERERQRKEREEQALGRHSTKTADQHNHPYVDRRNEAQQSVREPAKASAAAPSPGSQPTQASRSPSKAYAIADTKSTAIDARSTADDISVPLEKDKVADTSPSSLPKIAHEVTNFTAPLTTSLTPLPPTISTSVPPAPVQLATDEAGSEHVISAPTGHATSPAPAPGIKLEAEEADMSDADEFQLLNDVEEDDSEESEDLIDKSTPVHIPLFLEKNQAPATFIEHVRRNKSVIKDSDNEEEESQHIVAEPRRFVPMTEESAPPNPVSKRWSQESIDTQPKAKAPKRKWTTATKSASAMQASLAISRKLSADGSGKTKSKAKPKAKRRRVTIDESSNRSTTTRSQVPPSAQFVSSVSAVSVLSSSTAQFITDASMPEGRPCAQARTIGAKRVRENYKRGELIAVVDLPDSDSSDDEDDTSDPALPPDGISDSGHMPLFLPFYAEGLELLRQLRSTQSALPPSVKLCRLDENVPSALSDDYEALVTTSSPVGTDGRSWRFGSAQNVVYAGRILCRVDKPEVEEEDEADVAAGCFTVRLKPEVKAQIDGLLAEWTALRSATTNKRLAKSGSSSSSSSPSLAT